MSPYFLTTARIGFRNWCADDTLLAIALWTDAEVSKYIGGPFTPDQAKERLSRELENMRLHGLQYWPIFLLQSGAHLGCCGLRPHDPEQKIYELGFHIRSESWGQGIATEAASGVCKWAARDERFASLFAGHHPQNEASRAVLGKLGFAYTHDEVYAGTGLAHPSYRLLLRPST